MEKERPPRSRFREERLGEVPGDCWGVDPEINTEIKAYVMRIAAIFGFIWV